MRLARISRAGEAEFALGDHDGSWAPLSRLGIAARSTGEAIAALAAWAADDPAGLAERAEAEAEACGEERLLCPITRDCQVLGIGLNYADHAAETGAAPPAEPRVFAKLAASLNRPRGVVHLDPALTRALDYEVELAVVIGRETKRATVATAARAIFGYAVANDFTARDCQARDGQPTRAKGFDGFGPIGPWITSVDALPDHQEFRLRLSVNGEVRQESTTAQLLFSVAELIARVSAGTTLAPGDVILTGTPAGVGHGFDPPKYLAPGDVVVAEIDGLGQLRHEIIA